MSFSERVFAAKGKLHNFVEEVLALKNEGLAYAIFFGFLLLLLLPVLFIEILVLLILGKDAEIVQTRGTEIDDELSPEEVPENLQHLIRLAKKWGIGDAEVRGELLKNASIPELVELEHEVGPKMQQIGDWLDTYSESEVGRSATAGYFIYLGTAYEEVLTYLEQHQA
jgi:hypothetical protein